MYEHDTQVTEERHGFASMDRDSQKAIASKGGKAAHEKRRAHEFDRERALPARRADCASARTESTWLRSVARADCA